MGASWSQSESWHAVVTKDEVRDAVRGFEAWKKAQEESKAILAVQRSLPSTGTLLERVGGSDTVRRVVEAYCRKIYADEQLAAFLEDVDITSLRAKMSAFMIWLFSPADQTNTSRHLRTAHLRLIKRRDFTADHFEMGLAHFEAALRDNGLPEALVLEAMAKVRPYKKITFTPLPRDAEDERRWALQERLSRPSSAARSEPTMSVPLTPAGGPQAQTPPSPPPLQRLLQSGSQQPSSAPSPVQEHAMSHSQPPQPPVQPPPLSPPTQPHPHQHERRTAQVRSPHTLLLQPPDGDAGNAGTPGKPSQPPSPSAAAATASATSPALTVFFPPPSAASDTAMAAGSVTARQVVPGSSSTRTRSPPPHFHSAAYGDASQAPALAAGLGLGRGGGGGGDDAGKTRSPTTGGQLSCPANSASELPAGFANANAKAALARMPLPPPSPPLRLVSSGPATHPESRAGGSGGVGGIGSGGDVALPAKPLSMPALPPLPRPPPPSHSRSSFPSSADSTPLRKPPGYPVSR